MIVMVIMTMIMIKTKPYYKKPKNPFYKKPQGIEGFKERRKNKK